MGSGWAKILWAFFAVMMFYPLIFLLRLNEAGGGAAFTFMKAALYAILLALFLYPFITGFQWLYRGRRMHAFWMTASGVFRPVIAGIVAILIFEIVMKRREKPVED